MNEPCFGFIPARYASSRLPGKPLADIAGRPMFWHVWHQASQCAALRCVTLATDDERIASAAAALGVPCCMTSPDHVCGTDRIFEVTQQLKLPDDAIVVNIQGDEPLLDPVLIDELLAPFEDPAVRVSTVASPITAERAADPNQVKTVLDICGNALYFSRAPIPHARNREDAGCVEFLGHIGLYAFRMEALKRFMALPPSRLEQLEKLEQLRLLEHGIPIRVVRTNRHRPGVDTPEDLERVRRIVEAAR